MGLALVVGVGGGVVLAALAGARRSETAYSRLSDASNAADTLVVGQSEFLFVGNVDLDAVAGVTLAHTLVVSSVRRRRRDLAVLKTIGFVRRQVSLAVVWQATTLTGLAILIGVPLGTAAGRWAWTLFTAQLGVHAGPVSPPVPILLTIPATLVVANAIAAVPAWVAGRSVAALVLRTE